MKHPQADLIKEWADEQFDVQVKYADGIFRDDLGPTWNPNYTWRRKPTEPEWKAEPGDLVLMSNGNNRYVPRQLSMHKEGQNVPWLDDEGISWIFAKPHPLQLRHNKLKAFVKEIAKESATQIGSYYIGKAKEALEASG